MNRILDRLRGQLARPADLTDRHLLDCFLAKRDEAAFAFGNDLHDFDPDRGGRFPNRGGINRRSASHVLDEEDGRARGVDGAGRRRRAGRRGIAV